MSLVPIRTASLAPRIDERATNEATGSSRTPVDSGPQPVTNWAYWVTRKMNPDSAKNEIATDALAAVNRGFANSRTSTIGPSTRRSQATNIAARTAATAKPASVRTVPQP